MSEKLRRNEFYPVAERGISATRNIHAVWTGEKRCPRKGEWYLSGARIEAYRAPNDLSTPYHIARLVRTETKTVITITQVVD